MCLETTKQNFAFLQAFKEASDDGLDWFELVPEMERISNEYFQTRSYVNHPVPLSSLFDNFENRQTIREIGNGGYKLTESGLRSLALIASFALGNMPAHVE